MFRVFSGAEEPGLFLFIQQLNSSGQMDDAPAPGSAGLLIHSAAAGQDHTVSSIKAQVKHTVKICFLKYVFLLQFNALLAIGL